MVETPDDPGTGLNACCPDSLSVSAAMNAIQNPPCVGGIAPPGTVTLAGCGMTL